VKPGEEAIGRDRCKSGDRPCTEPLVFFLLDVRSQRVYIVRQCGLIVLRMKEINDGPAIAR
jgi:hypothetical protein